MRGSFDLRTGHLHLEEQPEALLENDALIAFCVGDILYDKTDPAQFRELLQHPDKDCSFYFEGPFLLLLYFKQEKRLFITQHPFGTPCNFFFAQSEGLFYFGTALSGIRDMLPIPFLLNTSALPQFIRNGFLTGTDTLISGVEKLPPEYSLTIGENEFRFTRLRWYGDSEPEADLNLEGLYDQVMEKAIRTSMDAFHAPEELTVTLSSGYDSNCILHYIKKLEPDAVVHTYSVGGEKGVDETIAAEQIAALYPHTCFERGLVTPGTRDALDEIVARLEGSVFERGIFLQYELASLLKRSGCSRIICGECADQVFNRKTYTERPDLQYLNSANAPYAFASNVILKKNVLMLHSFGIEVQYPFLNRDVIRMGYLTREQNGTTKEFHKQQCGRIFRPEVMAFLQKIGGSTTMDALFDSSFGCAEAIRKNKFYNQDMKIKEEPDIIDYMRFLKQRICNSRPFRENVREYCYSLQESVRKQYLVLAYLESFKRQFCDAP